MRVHGFIRMSLAVFTASPVVFLGLAVNLSGCVTPAAAEFAAEAEFTFKQYQVVIGSAERQTILTRFLFGANYAELAVVHIDENDDRRLRIYAFDNGTWAPKLKATLRGEVLL